MMKWILLIIIAGIVITPAWPQDLFSEKIRKIVCNKTSTFVKQGIFYTQGESKAQKLKALRHSFTKNNGYERIVFDFDSNEIPKIYGYLKSDNKKLYVDFFNTGLIAGLKSFGSSQYVKDVKIYPVSDDMLTMEFDFKDKVEFDIFCLKSPGRLVIDVK